MYGLRVKSRLIKFGGHVFVNIQQIINVIVKHKPKMAKIINVIIELFMYSVNDYVLPFMTIYSIFRCSFYLLYPIKNDYDIDINSAFGMCVKFDRET